MSGPPTDRPAAPARDGSVLSAGMKVLAERGLGTLLTLILVGAFLWFGVRFVSDAQTFQSQMIAESARTNEKLEQLSLSHIEMKLALDRVERLLLTQSGKATP